VTLFVDDVTTIVFGGVTVSGMDTEDEKPLELVPVT
jgi:hypothetical protein